MSAGTGRPGRRPEEVPAPVRVRPRWVWGGLVVALAGAAVLGLGVAVPSWAPAVTGGVLLVLGSVASLRGGLLHDATTRPDLGSELRAVRTGDVHAGVAPGAPADGSRARRPSPAARRDAVATNVATRDLEAAARRHAGVRWAPVAGWLLLLTTVVVTAAQWELVAHTATGRDNSVLDVGAAVLLGLSGLRLVTAPGRHTIATTVALLAGVVLVLNGLLGTHDHTGLAVVEVACGSIAVLGAVVAWTGSPPRR